MLSLNKKVERQSLIAREKFQSTIDINHLDHEPLINDKKLKDNLVSRAMRFQTETVRNNNFNN
jgi:hypothetical protein